MISFLGNFQSNNFISISYFTMFNIPLSVEYIECTLPNFRKGQGSTKQILCLMRNNSMHNLTTHPGAQVDLLQTDQ